MAINNNNNRFNNRSKNYIKEFTDFSEGYQELISLLPEVKLYAGTESSYEGVIQRILTTIGDNIPSAKNPNFPNTISFSINSREVGFLTDDKLAFGWKIFFNKETATHTYQFRITFLSVSMSKKKYIDGLINSGWQELDFSSGNNKQSRFWFRLNNPRRNNNRQQNYNSENYHNRQQNIQEDTYPATDEQIKNLQKKFNGSDEVEEAYNQDESAEFTEQNTDNAEISTPEEVNVVASQEPIQKESSENEIFSIQPGNLDGGYIISCGKEGTFTINFNGDIYPPGAIVDRENRVIRFNGIVYNCLEGTIYKEEE